MRIQHKLTTAFAAASIGIGVLAAPAPAAAAGQTTAKAGTETATETPGRYVVRRGEGAVRIPLRTRQAGEALVDVAAAAPGTDWSTAGAESAVVSIFVDGRYVTDLVVSGDTPTGRQFALGHLRAGAHLVQLRFAADRSAPASTRAVLSQLRVRTYPKASSDYLALRYAPVVYARTNPELGSPFQNAITDTPLLGWHEATPADTPGHTRLTYSVVWSNEDGGTDTPALMARWGRSTDIEWVYSVEVDEHGRRVAGSDYYQAADHQILRFAGRYEGDHALLQTCTANNNMCDTSNGSMRFFLSSLQTRPADKAREYLMDINPWTYRIMAKEMLREHKIEPPSPVAALTPEVSDQRNYLYTVVTKQTAAFNDGDSWVGVAIGVRLRNGSTYLSNHQVPDWSIQRDIPAATTVELPAGTTVADIVEVTAQRVVSGTDTGARVDVTSIGRGFFLGRDYLPGASFLSWNGDLTLTPDQPSATIWHAA
jgi:hypothetical protein